MKIIYPDLNFFKETHLGSWTPFSTIPMIAGGRAKMRQNSPPSVFYIEKPVFSRRKNPWASSSKEVLSEPSRKETKVDVSMEEASLYPPSRGTVDGSEIPFPTTWDGDKTL